MILVQFNLWVGIGTKFSKTIGVECMPTNLLKVLNHSFVVREHEQDLDGYIDGYHEHNHSCNTVRADINNDMHNPDDYEKIRKAFRKAGWEETTR